MDLTILLNGLFSVVLIIYKYWEGIIMWYCYVILIIFSKSVFSISNVPLPLSCTETFLTGIKQMNSAGCFYLPKSKQKQKTKTGEKRFQTVLK